jgi:hypothetical protein
MRVKVLMRLGWPVLLGMVLFLTLIMASAWGLGVPIPAVIISEAPLAAWLINAGLHRKARRPLRAAGRQLAEDMAAFRSMSNEVLMFLVSGCAGTVIGNAIPSAWTMALGQMVAGMPMLACMAVSAAIVLLSSAAIHPMLSAVVVGSSLSPALLGLPLLAHLSALLVGWGLAIIVTPFSVLSLMASRWSGIHVLTISLRANIAFVVLALAASGVLLGLMAKALA